MADSRNGRLASRRSYVLVTPARNEEAFIERTIAAVTSQVVKPLRWVIVNDGSSDRTAQIVAAHLSRHPFMELINLERSGERHFGNKAAAFNHGFRRVQHLPYGCVGNLDADISFGEDYFARLLARFDNEPMLGLAGGAVASYVNGKFVPQGVSPDSVAGAVQLFRRECFEAIGGYRLLPLGGIDAAAEIMARRAGWIVRTCFDLDVREHRRTGTAQASPLRARLREGRRLHSLGYDWRFFLLRAVWRAWEGPRILGSLAAVTGFALSAIRREATVLDPEVVAHLRQEQLVKLRQGLSRVGALRSQA